MTSGPGFAACFSQPNHLGVDEGSLVDLLTLSLEMEAYGSEGGFIPFLRHYSQFLRGMRTMRMLGVQKWGVRREGWRVLVERGSQERADMKTVVKDVTSQSALAADLPTFLSRCPLPPGFFSALTPGTISQSGDL